VPKHIVDLSESANTVFSKDKPRREDDRELRMQNVINFNQRKRQAMLKEMIVKSREGKKVDVSNTQAQKKAHNELFKTENKQLKHTLKKRIEKKKAINLKKINSIKLKKKKV
jgi:hypothetical protein